MRSIDFFCATASAICCRLSRFALSVFLLDLLGEFTFVRRVLGHTGLRVVGRIVCRVLFYRLDVVAVIDRVLLLVGLRHVEELVGHHELGGGGGGRRRRGGGV